MAKELPQSRPDALSGDECTLMAASIVPALAAGVFIPGAIPQSHNARKQASFQADQKADQKETEADSLEKVKDEAISEGAPESVTTYLGAKTTTLRSEASDIRDRAPSYVEPFAYGETFLSMITVPAMLYGVLKARRIHKAGKTRVGPTASKRT